MGRPFVQGQARIYLRDGKVLRGRDCEDSGRSEQFEGRFNYIMGQFRSLTRYLAAPTK